MPEQEIKDTTEGNSVSVMSEKNLLTNVCISNEIMMYICTNTYQNVINWNYSISIVQIHMPEISHNVTK